MQGSWNVVPGPDGVCELLNGSGTLITKAKRVPFGHITRLLSDLEEISFPVELSRDLREIYFTYMHGDRAGFYEPPGVIWLSCTSDCLDELTSTFVHEIGHHVDLSLGVTESESKGLLRELNKAHLLRNILREDLDGDDAEEFFASGFELFWRSPVTRQFLFIFYPHLHNTIRDSILEFAQKSRL